MAQAHFDYKKVTEEKDELDFENLVPCFHCKKPIPSDATMCLYCGHEVTHYGSQQWVIWVAIILIVIFAVFIIQAIY